MKNCNANFNYLQDEIIVKVEQLRDEVPLILRPIRKPTDLDADDPHLPDLPPPLSPQIVTNNVIDLIICCL